MEEDLKEIKKELANLKEIIENLLEQKDKYINESLLHTLPNNLPRYIPY